MLDTDEVEKQLNLTKLNKRERGGGGGGKGGGKGGVDQWNEHPKAKL